MYNYQKTIKKKKTFLRTIHDWRIFRAVILTLLIYSVFIRFIKQNF